MPGVEARTAGLGREERVAQRGCGVRDCHKPGDLQPQTGLLKGSSRIQSLRCAKHVAEHWACAIHRLRDQHDLPL